MYHGDYCGDEIPPKITTKTNVVRVIFWSTFIDPLETNTRSGFLARYRFLYVEPGILSQTCPCNILQYFTAVKQIIFR